VYKSWALSCPGDQIFKAVPTIFNTIVSFFLTHKNVYQFTYTEQIAPDNTAVERSNPELWALSMELASSHPSGT